MTGSWTGAPGRRSRGPGGPWPGARGAARRPWRGELELVRQRPRVSPGTPKFAHLGRRPLEGVWWPDTHRERLQSSESSIRVSKTRIPSLRSSSARAGVFFLVNLEGSEPASPPPWLAAGRRGPGRPTARSAGRSIQPGSSAALLELKGSEDSEDRVRLGAAGGARAYPSTTAGPAAAIRVRVTTTRRCQGVNRSAGLHPVGARPSQPANNDHDRHSC